MHTPKQVAMSIFQLNRALNHAMSIGCLSDGDCQDLMKMVEGCTSQIQTAIDAAAKPAQPITLTRDQFLAVDTTVTA